MGTLIIAVISQKGGVGKSTLSRALTAEAARSGDLNVVKLADLDTQQGTCIDWHRRRLEAGIEPVFSVEAFKTAAQALRSVENIKDSEKHSLLVVDGPARASAATLEIAKAAHLVIQPTGASVDDLRPGVLTFHELVREGVRKELLVFVLCKTGTDAEEAEARAYIEQAGYVVLPGSIPERPAYRQAQNAGYAILETKYPALNKRVGDILEVALDHLMANLEGDSEFSPSSGT